MDASHERSRRAIIGQHGGLGKPPFGRLAIPLKPYEITNYRSQICNLQPHGQALPSWFWFFLAACLVLGVFSIPLRILCNVSVNLPPENNAA